MHIGRPVIVTSRAVYSDDFDFTFDPFPNSISPLPNEASHPTIFYRKRKAHVKVCIY